MRRCPECRRDYYDDSLLFCLDDGSALLEGPSTNDHPTRHLPADTIDPLRSESGTTQKFSEEQTSRFRKNSGTATRLGIAALMLAVIIGIGFAVYKVFWKNSATAVPAAFQAMKMSSLTSNGKATSAVISPDGKQVIYVIYEGGLRSLWLRQVATGSDVQLTTPEDIQYFSLTISPDGNFLYYASGGTTVRNRVLYRMPVLGGNPRKVIDDTGTAISFSPGGGQIAFVRNAESESALMIANADGTEERTIAVRQRPNGNFGNFFQGGTAWSPDGKKIALITHNYETDRGFQNVVEVPVEGGPERLLTPQKWFQIQRLAWLADGSGLVMTAAEQSTEIQYTQIWHLSYPGGEVRKITNDLKEYQNISLSADSGVMVTVQADRDTNIWVAPKGDAARAKQLTSVSSRMDGSIGVSWATDGRIVYYSLAGGSEGIWIMDADGRNRKQLTNGETADFFPSVSSDGRYIVFTSERTGTRGIWRMGVDGSDPKQLAGGSFPQATGEWVVFQGGGGGGVLRKVSIEGGEAVEIAKGMAWCAVSPDGKLLACARQKPLPAKLAVLPIEGGEPLKLFDAEPNLPGRIRWSPDGREVYFVAVQNGISDIWSQSIGGGEPRKLTNFKSNRIFSFDWSRDDNLVISHGSATSDVVLIRDTKQ